MRPHNKPKNQKKVIEQQVYTPSNGMRVSNRYPMYGHDYIGQYGSPNNIPGPQELNIYIINVLGYDGMSLYMHTRNKDN